MSDIKQFKNSLRMLIAGSSVMGFVAGWVLLAHSGKPVQVTSAPAPLAPASSISQLGPIPGNIQDPNLQPLAPIPAPQYQFTPRLRTGGS